MIPKQYRIHVILMVSCLVMVLFPILSEIPDSEKAELATAAATDFLALLDDEQHDQSWQSSAALMKERISVADWAEKMTKVRALTGPNLGREEDDISYSTMAKDSPDGEYIVLRYKSKFQKQDQVVESITVMLEGDGHWRVAGYYIQ